MATLTSLSSNVIIKRLRTNNGFKEEIIPSAILLLHRRGRMPTDIKPLFEKFYPDGDPEQANGNSEKPVKAKKKPAKAKKKVSKPDVEKSAEPAKAKKKVTKAKKKVSDEPKKSRGRTRVPEPEKFPWKFEVGDTVEFPVAANNTHIDGVQEGKVLKIWYEDTKWWARMIVELDGKEYRCIKSASKCLKV